MEVAEVHDRMHLKTTHYAYAKHAEALGEYPAAISRLERDGCLCLWGFVLIVNSSGSNFFHHGIQYYNMYVWSIMKADH